MKSPKGAHCFRGLLVLPARESILKPNVYPGRCYKNRVKTLNQSSVKTEILQRVTALTPNSTRKWGKMTAHQAICHLTDSLKAVIGERDITYPKSSALQQTFMRWIALYVPIPWVQGVKTAPETDQQLQGTPPAEFARDKAVLLESLERVAAGQAPWIAVHPIFGTMTEHEWQRFEYLHFDHHLRQFGV